MRASRLNSIKMKLLQYEFCQIFKDTFFKEHLSWLFLKMKTAKPKYCTLHPDWTIVIFEWFVMHYFGSSSKWTFSIASQKLKYGKTKWIISFLYSYKKIKFSLAWVRCDCTQCNPLVTPLQHIYKKGDFIFPS